MKKILYYLRTIPNREKLFPLILLCFVVLTHGYFAATHIPFSQDYGRDLSIIQQYIEKNHLIISYGPKTSVGDFYVFPLYYQLFLLSQILFQHPLAMNVVVVLLEALTPVFVYFILSFFVSRKIAITSAAMYSISALVLQFSTSTWSPNLIPLLTSVSLYAWLRFFIDNHRPSIVLGILGIGLALHLHFQIVVLIPFLCIAVLFSLLRSVANIKYILLGCGLVAITYMPYFVAEISADWPNTREIIAFYTQEHALYYDRISKPRYVLTFFPKLTENILINTNTPLYWFGTLLFFTGMGILAWKSRRSTRHRWLLAYFLIIFLMLRVYKGDKHEYYMMTLFILPSVMIALILDQLQKISPKLTLGLGIVLLALVATNLGAPRFNQYALIQHDVEQLGALIPEGESAHVIFHNLDDINTYQYFFKLSDLIILNRQSDVIIDICDEKQTCWNNLLSCNNNLSTTYSNYLKFENDYTLLETYEGNAFYASIGRISNKPKIFPQADRDITNRRDLIITDIN